LGFVDGGRYGRRFDLDDDGVSDDDVRFEADAEVDAVVGYGYGDLAPEKDAGFL
jgi:hypothetical protein